MRIAAATLCLWLTLAALVMQGCTPDIGTKKTIKVEDPFASESESEFQGLITTFFKLPVGESTLVSLPNGKKLLVDTGAVEDIEALEAGLSERGITVIDYLMITNDLPEYMGGFKAIAEKMQIGTVILPKLTSASILPQLHLKADQRIALLSEGDYISLDKNVTIKVLHPSEPLFLSPQENSLVFQLQHDRLRFLFTSSINEKAEERLLSRHPGLLKSEVLKVTARGSNQGSSQPFLTKVDAQVAVILTGKSRQEMRTSQEEIVERLGESWSETYITSQDGTIAILSNGKDYRVLKSDK